MKYIVLSLLLIQSFTVNSADELLRALYANFASLVVKTSPEKTVENQYLIKLQTNF